MDTLSRLPLHPFLLAAYPILFLYSANLTEVLPVDAVEPLAWAIVAAAVIFGLLAVVLRRVPSAALITSALVVGWFFFGHAAPAFEAAGAGRDVQLGVWALALGGFVVLALTARHAVGQLNLAANVVALVLVALALASIVPYEVGRATRGVQAGTPPDPSLPAATRHPGRDIYYLVFDRYGSDWSIEQRFGIDNDLTAWLSEQGFHVVPGARANYRASDLSIASTLNMRYLDELTERYGRETGDRTPAWQLLRAHDVGRFLQQNGYRFLHVSPWYSPTLDSDIADEVLRYDEATELAQVLHDTSLAPVVHSQLFQATGEPPDRVRHRAFAHYQVRQVARAATLPEHTFVFAHILLPHPAYVFRRDGSDMTLQEAQTLPEEVLYEEQLAYTNKRIRETVSALLAGPPESDPIIIIQADEGPFLCRNVDCIDRSPETYGIRYGVLGAYYLPGLPPDVLPPDHSSVNTFRTVFREYFGADFAALPNRSFDWPNSDRLYDFFDMTDQLPLPGTAD